MSINDMYKRDRHGNRILTKDEDPVLYKLQQDELKAQRSSKRRMQLVVILTIVMLAILVASVVMFTFFTSFEYVVRVYLILLAVCLITINANLKRS